MEVIFTFFRKWIHQIPRTVRSVVAFATRHPAPIVGPAASTPAVLAVAVVTAAAVSSREVAAASVVRTAVGSRIEVRIWSLLCSTRSYLNFLIDEEFFFFFISVVCVTKTRNLPLWLLNLF